MNVSQQFNMAALFLMGMVTMLMFCAVQSTTGTPWTDLARVSVPAIRPDTMFPVVLGLLFVVLPVVDASCQSAVRKCPKGSPVAYCKVAPCEVNQCPRYPGARCVNDYCGGCNARYYVNKTEVTQFCPSSPPKCPDGNPPVQCFVAPCRDKTCPAYPQATCVDDYCGGCNFLFVYNDTDVTSLCAGDLCPADKPTVNCFASPCNVSTCPRYPNARCVDNYCGGCNAQYFVNNTEVTQFCSSSPPVCPDGSRPVQCFQQPCNATRCQAFPDATCVDDYCGGCNARFHVNKTEVTYKCCDTPPVNQCPSEDQVQCFVDPCDSRITSCNNVQTAACSSDYCNGCRDRWFLPDCSEATSTCNRTITQ